LIAETIEVLNYVMAKFPNISVIMVGHSMGGSIACKATEKIFEQRATYTWFNRIKGIFCNINNKNSTFCY